MEKQKRKFTLAEVHTKVGPIGQIQLDLGFLKILGIEPDDCVVFLIDTEGVVTVKGEKKSRELKTQTAAPGIPRPGDVAQAPLFGDAAPKPVTQTRRRRSQISKNW